MSVQVLLDQLTTDQVSLIQRHLKLQANIPRWTQSAIPPDPIPPIIFYSADSTTVSLPKAFGTKLVPDLILPISPSPVQFAFTATLLEHQVSICDEAMSGLQSSGGTILNVYPGCGKTVMAAKLAAELGYLTLVVCHRETLTRQWLQTFQTMTTANIWIVGTPVPITPVHVVISMNGQVPRLPLEFRQQIGTLILDEAHALCTPSNVGVLLSTTPKYVISATATLDRPDGLQSMVYAVSGLHKVERMSSKPFTVIKLMTGVSVETQSGRQGGVDWADLRKKLFEHPQRNELILKLVETHPQAKIIILTDRIEHANYLTSRLKENNESVDVLAGSKKTYSNSRILVGTTSKIGTGFDEKSACPDFDGNRIDLAIICFSTKQVGLLEQSVGRAFRAEFPTIIHLVDDIDTIKRHWTTAQKWYKSRSGEIKIWHGIQ